MGNATIPDSKPRVRVLEPQLSSSRTGASLTAVCSYGQGTASGSNTQLPAGLTRRRFYSNTGYPGVERKAELGRTFKDIRGG